MIETERLILRPMKPEDIDLIKKIFSDINVLKAFNLEKPLSEVQVQGWLERNLEHQDRYGYGLYTVVLKSNNELIGDCGLEHTDFNGAPCVELGYDFLSEYWNQGYATEAATAVRDYAINFLDIDPASLCSFIRKNNAASRRVSEKIGMKQVQEYTKYDTDYYLYAYSNSLIKDNGEKLNR